MVDQPNLSPCPGSKRPPLIFEAQQAKLIVGERNVPLSRGQYQLFLLLYQQRKVWLETARGPRCLKVETLAQRTGLSPQAIPRLISRTNERLKCHQWVIGAIHFWGYALFLLEEVDEVSES